MFVTESDLQMLRCKYCHTYNLYDFSTLLQTKNAQIVCSSFQCFILLSAAIVDCYIS